MFTKLVYNQIFDLIIKRNIIISIKYFLRYLRGSGVGSFFDFTGTFLRLGLSLKAVAVPRSFPTIIILC